MRPSIAELAIKLLELVLFEPVIKVPEGAKLDDEPSQFHMQVKGLTTGLSSASTISNVFLGEGFDAFLRDSFPIKKYCRFIDDGCAILDTSRVSRDEVKAVLNSWGPSLRVAEKDLSVADKVHFLDLWIGVEPETRKTYLTTFRKVENIYDYVPTTSCHHPMIFPGLQIGELNRMLVTNTRHRDWAEQILFFMKKLRSRGYSTIRFAHLVENWGHERRKQVLDNRRKLTEAKKAERAAFRNAAVATNDKAFEDVGITLKFVRGSEQVRWKKLRRPLGVFKDCVKKPLRFTVRNSVHKNMFRLLYRATWQGG